MDRTISTERLYYLGDYKNIKFGNTLNGIPEELAKNDKVISLLYFQQVLACETAYRQYVDMMEKINNDLSVVVNGRKVADADAVLDFLQTQRNETLAELLATINETTKKETE